jgi:NitT/TauT family transport system permease protein
MALILLIWQLLVNAQVYPSFILPAPMAVWEKLYDVTVGGARISLALHLRVTFTEVLIGLIFGVTTSVALGYIIAKTPLLESLLSPIIVGFQATPVVAYAPLLVIWFGAGWMSKVITCALIVFFPMLMGTIVGIRGVSVALRDLMRSLNATPLQMFLHLEVPAAAPILFNGLKVSATLAVIGAVVGEFVSANAGLGFLVNIARSQYDTPLVIVAVLTLTFMALGLYSFMALLEWYALSWRRRVR